MCFLTLDNVKKGNADFHRKEAARLRKKAAACHPAAGGHTNSRDRYEDMADAHDAAASRLEEQPAKCH